MRRYSAGVRRQAAESSSGAAAACQHLLAPHTKLRREDVRETRTRIVEEREPAINKSIPRAAGQKPTGSNSYRGTVALRAKICGIRSEADLRIAVDAGADALGFISGVTHFSEDALDADAAARLAGLVPPFITRVLVTHLEDAAAIVELADRIGTDAIQVHGLVTADTVRQVKKAARGRRVIKAVHVTGPDAVDTAREAASDCDAVLLDSRTANRLGGTGRTHDWSISAAIVSALAELNCPVILAGGLTPANVTQAIEAVRPFAIDVNSGVETATGDKQPEACTAFVHAAHRAFNRIEPPAPQP